MCRALCAHIERVLRLLHALHVLVKRILEIHPARLESGRIGIRQIIRDRVNPLLLGCDTGRSRISALHHSSFPPLEFCDIVDCP